MHKAPLIYKKRIENFHTGGFDFDNPNFVAESTPTSNNKRIICDSERGIYL